MRRSIQKERTCLRCGKIFNSLSSANRICNPCKKTQYGVYAEATVVQQEDMRNLQIQR